MSIASIISPETGNITLYTNKSQYSITSTHANYKKIVEALKNKDEAALDILCDIPKAIQSFTAGLVEIRDGKILFGGSELHNVVCDRILSFMNKGLPFEPLVNFLNNLMENPSNASVEQLYYFLEVCGLAITEDGCFLGFKSVRENTLRDHHSNTVEYKVGSVVQMRRNLVNEQRDVGCSTGLHVGSRNYALSFHSGNSTILMVKVNPKNVVSVPSDCSNQKLRCCELEVVKIMSRDDFIQDPLYTNKGESVSHVPQEDDFDDFDDWDDDDEESSEDAYIRGYEDARQEMKDLLG